MLHAFWHLAEVSFSIVQPAKIEISGPEFIQERPASVTQGVFEFRGDPIQFLERAGGVPKAQIMIRRQELQFCPLARTPARVARGCQGSRALQKELGMLRVPPILGHGVPGSEIYIQIVRSQFRKPDKIRSGLLPAPDVP